MVEDASKTPSTSLDEVLGDLREDDADGRLRSLAEYASRAP